MNKETIKVRNFGDLYFYPSTRLMDGLKEVVIFKENTIKHEIPNGSIWIYDSKIPYIPEILDSDIGCGITSFITGEICFDENSRHEILKAVDSIGIHLGQGNHFLDLTIGHPDARRKNLSGNMIFLHSDFNNKNIIPLDFKGARNLMEQAKEKRHKYLEKLTLLLGITAKFYRDWTHNTVTLDGDVTIYRKGAINVSETDGVGVLALDPVDGLYLYAAEFNDYYSSMQHAAGRIGSKSELLGFMKKESYGIARGYVLPSELCSNKDFKETRAQTYNKIDKFTSSFWMQNSMIGFCVPEYVIGTKI